LSTLAPNSLLLPTLGDSVLNQPAYSSDLVYPLVHSWDNIRVNLCTSASAQYGPAKLLNIGKVQWTYRAIMHNWGLLAPEIILEVQLFVCVSIYTLKCV